MYLWCLSLHYPAITPKCLISTSVTWSIGVKCLISTRNMVISWCRLKTTNGPKNAPEAISVGLKFNNFSGGACPQTPLEHVLLCAVLWPPQILSKYHYAPPCPFFWMKNWLWIKLDVTTVDPFIHVAFDGCLFPISGVLNSSVSVFGGCWILVCWKDLYWTPNPNTLVAINTKPIVYKTSHL